jgi:hypothetical protein
MAITTISSLKAGIGVGARSNLFEVTITDAGGTFTADDGDAFKFLCRGAQLPSSTLGLIEVPFQAGRRYKLAGDRTFAEWTTTVYNDSNQTIRQALENLQIQYGVVDYESGIAKTRYGVDDSSEFSTVTVTQFDLAGNETYKYELVNCWPLDISTIDLSYDNTDTIEDFTVTWAYDYFTFEQL